GELPVQLKIEFSPNPPGRGAVGGTQYRPRGIIDGVLITLSPELTILGEQRYPLRAAFVLQESECDAGMHIDNVLSPNGIDDSKLIVAGREKLVEGVARIITLPAARNIKPQKRPGRQHGFLERVATNNCN